MDSLVADKVGGANLQPTLPLNPEVRLMKGVPTSSRGHLAWYRLLGHIKLGAWGISMIIVCQRGLICCPTTFSSKMYTLFLTIFGSCLESRQPTRNSRTFLIAQVHTHAHPLFISLSLSLCVCVRVCVCVFVSETSHTMVLSLTVFGPQLDKGEFQEINKRCEMQPVKPNYPRSLLF